MRRRKGRTVRLVVLVVVLVGLVLPTLAGLAAIVAAALGHVPALGRADVSPFANLAAIPGALRAAALSLWTGLAATAISLLLAVGGVAGLVGRLGPGRLVRWLAPILATPHAALAIGLAFVIAPSGWIARGLGLALTGWERPPELATVHDPMGMALILGLVVKETPFLMLAILAGLSHSRIGPHLDEARALGYRGGRVWAQVALPLLYPALRLPIYAVLVFSVSVVDMALILGPTSPPTLSVIVLRLFHDPDLSRLMPASAGALALVGVTLVALAVWRLAEIAVGRLALHRLRAGRRGRGSGALVLAATGLVPGLALLALLALLSLVLWSLAWRWPFPDPLPESWSLQAWRVAGDGLIATTLRSALIALAATGLSLCLAILWLEGEELGDLARARWAEWMLYLPLLVPQIGFLQGVHVLALVAGLREGWVTVLWAHMLFVFPYVMVALSDPWRAFDPRQLRSAAALGAGPIARLFRVKLPCLLAPLLMATAVGLAVSMAQYLPTLLLGGGRIVTLATEAVSLSSGSDRRIAAATAFLQALLPVAAYALALAGPARIFRNRRALRGARL